MKKKLLTLLTICLLPIALLAGSGDVNGDGKVNVADIVEIINYLNGHPSETFNFAEADANNDGYMTIEDVDALKNVIMTMGQDPSLELVTKDFLVTESGEFNNIEITIKGKLEKALGDVEFEYLDGCDEWINIYNNDFSRTDEGFSIVFYASVSPNTKTLERIGRIVFKNNTYGYRDTITVHTVGYFKTKKKEYHVANQSNRLVLIEFDTNLDGETLGGMTFKVTCEDGEWLRASGTSFEYDNNETAEVREATISISIFDKTETIKVIHHPAEIANKSSLYYVVGCQPSGDIVDIPIKGLCDNLPIDVYSMNGWQRTFPEYMTRLEDEVRNDTLFVRLEVDENTSQEQRHEEFYIKMGDSSEMWFHLLQPGSQAPSFAEQKEALISLYQSTDGDHWTNHTNWLSDKPINEWYGVNNDRNNDIIVMGNYVLRIQLWNNNLNGKLPPEFVCLMPNCSFKYFGSSLEWAMTIYDNHLYGKIPESISSHQSWGNVGWMSIIQHCGASDKELFDYDGYNLQTQDSKLEYMVGENNPPAYVYDIIKEHELTLVHYAGDVCPDWRWFTGITDERVNLFMNYRNKGLGMVMVTSRYWDEPFDPFIDYVKKRHEHGVPKDIHWVIDRFGDIEPHCVGTDYLLDKEGNLIQVYTGSCVSETFCLPRVDSVCRARLGAPEEHEKFVSKYYTSTDYSKDGEVTKLQTATIGDGIDVVFVGEAYLDTEMGEGGIYEQTMQEAMESFFSEEPYKSLRNRFNIYAVKAVSPNDAFVHGVTQLAIGGSIEKAFEYAKKAVGDRDDRLMVGVICKPGAIAERSQTFMFEEDGSFAAWMFTGTGRYVLTHEMGGHGVAFLLDEYVENGWDEASPDEDRKAYLDEMYTKYGEGANVDWRNDPTQVRWTHFINDSRYVDEHIGIFEGACLYGHGCYRPTGNSMMRNNDCGFNAPSREAIYKRVMKLSEGSGWNYDYETFVSFDTPAREAYRKAKARQTDDNKLQKRIESRPPTIYKGTWRDAGKCEKVEYNKMFDK